MKNKKVLITIIIIILIAASGFLGYNYYLKKQIPSKKELQQKVSKEQTTSKKQSVLQEEPTQEEMTDKGKAVKEEPESEDKETDALGWLTFKNEKHGYEIKYPKEAKIKTVQKILNIPAGEPSQSDNIAIEFIVILPTYVIEPPTDFFTTTEGKMFFSASIKVIENPQRLSGEEWYKQLFKKAEKEYESGLSPLLIEPIKRGSIMLSDNIMAYRVIEWSWDQQNDIYAYISKDNLLYKITGSAIIVEPTESKAEHYEIFDVMLNTFRFIEE